MKAEKYLLNYAKKSNIALEYVKTEMGIDLEELVNNNDELMADEFIRLCICLGVNPDDVMNAVV